MFLLKDRYRDNIELSLGNDHGGFDLFLKLHNVLKWGTESGKGIENQTEFGTPPLRKPKRRTFGENLIITFGTKLLGRTTEMDSFLAL